MPIPFLFIGIAAATGLLGIGETAKAVSDRHDAKETNAQAKEIIDGATDSANKARKICGDAIQKLGESKVNVLDTSMKKFIDSFEKIHNVEFSETVGMDELRRFKFDKKSLSELKELNSIATSIAAGVGSGALAGALTAFGAYSVAGAFATASTGTAIASLSGAAATNATLAFFGGGSLAAGGLGVAGGTTVLGGLVAGPALAIMGLVVGAQAKAARDNAYSNLSLARKYKEEMMTAVIMSNGIRKRACMMNRLLIKLQCIFDPLVFSIENMVETVGTDFSKYTIKQQNTVAACVSLAGAIKAVLDTPLLTEDGKLTSESESIASQVEPILLKNA